MRICYLAGPGVHTNRWAKYFADRGHEVHMVASGRPSGSPVDNVKLHLLKRFGPRTRIIGYLINSVPIVTQLKIIISKIKPDVIHAHAIEESALLGAVSGFHPFVVTAWGSDVLIATKESRVSRWIVKCVLKRADLITCDAEHIKKPLMELGANSQKIKRINFGVDTRKFKPGQNNRRLGEDLGIVDSPTIISLRFWEALYDIETLIASMPLVLEEIPQAKLVLLGGGSQEGKLKELSKSLGVSDSVRFVGQVPADELPQYLVSADIFVSIALSDAGLAASTAEAMACGLPVIITDFGDNREWVEDGVNGFIIPLRSPQVLASRIVYLIRNKDIRQKFGQINRQIIVERNNWEKEMGKMEKFYEELTRNGTILEA